MRGRLPEGWNGMALGGTGEGQSVAALPFHNDPGQFGGETRERAAARLFLNKRKTKNCVIAT